MENDCKEVLIELGLMHDVVINNVYYSKTMDEEDFGDFDNIIDAEDGLIFVYEGVRTYLPKHNISYITFKEE